MTSMVAGQLSNATLPLATLFHALFPCGSITGAPKLNTMSYIHKLEDQPRYIYCGTLGILMPDDKMILMYLFAQLNIVIIKRYTVSARVLLLILILKMKCKNFVIKLKFWRCYK